MALANLIGGTWTTPERETLPVYNPATGEVIEQVPLGTADDVDAAVRAATQAYATWSQTPVMDRAQLMFRFKALLE